MKAPIQYYGGKHNLLFEIEKMIPAHGQYVEPFMGGGSMFWNKRPSEHEVVNDFDGRLINFYEQLKDNFDALNEKVQSTLHSELYHTRARLILKQFPDGGTPLENAWAYWVQSQMSFSHKLFGGFAFANGRGQPTATKNRKQVFVRALSKRLSDVEIFNRYAIELILMKDTPDTFFYLDPPYAEADCAQYEKQKGVYYLLLDILPNIKGKWLMSSYPSHHLTELRKLHKFNHKDIEQNLSVTGKQGSGRRKTECLTWNYDLGFKQTNLF